MDPVSNVLILRALKLGDLLVAVPAIRAVRRAHPRADLILAAPAWLEPIVDLIGAVDHLHPTPGLDHPPAIPSGQIEMAINMHGNGQQSAAVICALEARMVVTHGGGGPAWQEGALERYRWVRLVESYGMPGDPDEVGISVPQIDPPRPGAAVVHVGAFYGSRRWPIIHFADVCRALAAAGHEIVLTGSGAERPRAKAVAEAAGLPGSSVLAGCIGLREFAAQVSAAGVVISADTGAAHLASAYGRPSVVIFGPAPPEQWGPPPGPHVVLTHSDLRRGDAFAAEPDPALLAVTPTEVMAAVSRVLQ